MESIKISNKLLRDVRLGALEKGIMIVLLSKGDDYVFYSTRFFREEKVGVGEVKYNRAIKYLLSLGYLEKKRIQGGVSWTINEETNNY